MTTGALPGLLENISPPPPVFSISHSEYLLMLSIFIPGIGVSPSVLLSLCWGPRLDYYLGILLSRHSSDVLKWVW